MTSRNWYIAKSAGLQLLVLFALAWWMTVIALAVTTQSQSRDNCSAYDQLFGVVLRGN